MCYTGNVADSIKLRIALWNERAEALWEKLKALDLVLAQVKSEWENVANEYTMVTATLHDLQLELPEDEMDLHLGAKNP